MANIGENMEQTHINTQTELQTERPHVLQQVDDLITHALTAKDEEIASLRRLNDAQRRTIHELEADNARLSNRPKVAPSGPIPGFPNMANYLNDEPANGLGGFQAHAGRSTGGANSLQSTLRGVPGSAMEGRLSPNRRADSAAAGGSERSNKRRRLESTTAGSHADDPISVDDTPARVKPAAVAGRKGFFRPAAIPPPVAPEAMFNELDFWDESKADDDHRSPTTNWTDSFKTMVKPHLTDRFCTDSTTFKALLARNNGHRKDMATCAQMKVSKAKQSTNVSLPNESCSHCRDKQLICVRSINDARPMAVPLAAELRVGLRSDELGYWVMPTAVDP